MIFLGETRIGNVMIDAEGLLCAGKYGVVRAQPLPVAGIQADAQIHLQGFRQVVFDPVEIS